MLDQRRKRWPNIKPALDERLVSACHKSILTEIAAVQINVMPAQHNRAANEC